MPRRADKKSAAHARTEKVLFLVDPGRRHLIVELDQAYNRKELTVLLAAFRNRLAGTEESVLETPPDRTEPVDRIVGPGFVIDMIQQENRR